MGVPLNEYDSSELDNNSSNVVINMPKEMKELEYDEVTSGTSSPTSSLCRDSDAESDADEVYCLHVYDSPCNLSVHEGIFTEEEDEFEIYRFLSTACFIDQQSAASSEHQQEDKTDLSSSFPGFDSSCFHPLRKRTSFRRISSNLSQELKKHQSSVREKLPETTGGWMVVASALAAAGLGYEIKVQRDLTCPPIIYGQPNAGPLQEITAKITQDPESVFTRSIQPSLFVGTNSLVSSTSAYLGCGPKTIEHVRFREILTMPADGTSIGLDWELPLLPSGGDEALKSKILSSTSSSQCLDLPVVLILHGMNNHANFGYVRSLMRACTDRGWVAAAMNFRGCGGVKMTTPRAYNAAYTGDIRGVCYSIARRMTPGVPMMMCGSSMGASLLTKFLGEEGRSGTLPSCVAGAVAQGNPMRFDTEVVNPLFSPVLALGLKKTLLENWASVNQMTDPAFRTALRDAFMAKTFAEFDLALSPHFARNDPLYPYSFSVGYADTKEYWEDACAFRYVRHISVPTMQLVAGDDFLCFDTFKGKMAYTMANPNLIVVESKCGGHLGWQEAAPGSGNIGNVGTSWADVATTDFLSACMDTYYQQQQTKQEPALDMRKAPAGPPALVSRL